jgi:hypothetical protein
VRLAWRFVVPAIVAVVLLVVLLSLPQLPTSRALGIWVVVAAALVLYVLNRHAQDRYWPAAPPRFEQALQRRKPKPAQPEELLRMDRELVLGSADADHAHRRLLPLLRSVAAARIGARHGFELERRPEAARELLGDDVWELLRPDRPAPEDRHAEGVPREQILAVIERVESL